MGDLRDRQLRNEMDYIFYWNNEEDLQKQEEAREEKEDREHKMFDLVR
jgi:hypothetical protein